MIKNYKKVLLVTGGAGFIGSAFLRKFVITHTNWFFLNLDLLTYAGDLFKLESVKNEPNYKFIHGDIGDFEIVNKIFEEFNVNTVINFAAESHVDNSISNSTVFIETNINGVHNLLEVARKNWELMEGNESKKCRFIQISTDEVYGQMTINERPWTETDSLNPNSPYSASKAASELLCRAYYKTYGLPVIITRSSNNYGPYQHIEKLIPKIINSLRTNELIPIYGNGLNIRDWIYVDDNVEGILTIVIRGNPGEIYNIGGANEMNNITLTKIIMERFPNSKSKIKFVSDRPAHDFRYSINSSRLLMLGWLPKVKFEDGLISTIRHYTDNKVK